MEGLLGFLLAGLALAGSPGPNTLSLAATGAAFGWRLGLGYLVGLVVGMVVVMAITATGMIGVLLAIPGATPVVTVIAAAYFAWLAYRIATAPPLSERGEQRQAPTFLAGIGLSLVNPKGYAAMAALYSGFVLLRGSLVADALVKTAFLTAIIIGVNIAWLFAGAALTGAFRNPTSNRIINIAFAVLLVVSVILAVV